MFTAILFLINIAVIVVGGLAYDPSAASDDDKDDGPGPYYPCS